MSALSIVFWFSIVTCGYAQLARNLADIPCGQQWRRGSRIIGGENAFPGEFPWLVSIRRSGGHFCGGSIVSRRWVLTAGHCMCSGRTVISAGQLQVAIGEHDLKSSGEELLRVKKIHLHPEYVCPRFINDIALLELEVPIDWNPNVSPACLPVPLGYSGASLFSDREATAAGWGWMDENYSVGNRADILQKVKVTVFDNDKCRNWYQSQGKKVKILDTQMCAGSEHGGKDSCWADSGGPLMVRSSDGVVVVGVVSNGIGCGRPKLPGLYTRTSSYMPWVLSMVNG